MKEKAVCCIILLYLSLVTASPLMADGDVILDRQIQLLRGKGTRYKLLNRVSEKIGYSLIYDSRLFDNEEVIKIEKGTYTVREAIFNITDNRRLQFQVKDNHILIYIERNKPELPQETNILRTNISYSSLRGRLLDAVSRTPVTNATVSSSIGSIGTVSNRKGEFILNLPDSLRQFPIGFSHIGYRTNHVSVDDFKGEEAVFLLEPIVIPLQEVVVRVVDPIHVLDEMLRNRKRNYFRKPVYLTTFYREGTHYNKDLIRTSEAVFNVYKKGIDEGEEDQVKLYKMRTIQGDVRIHSVVPKIEAGVQTSLLMDIVDYLPDFLKISQRHMYTFTHTDITTMDGRLVNVISFEQLPNCREPLFCGELYIDMENFALLHAQFRIHPDFVETTAPLFIRKKSKKLKVTPQSVVYSVSYRMAEDRYHLHHIRGDLHFKVRKRGKLFSSPMYAWFEMFTSELNRENVVPFPKGERLKTRTIFSETRFVYDETFWNNFNFILPEEQLKNIDSYQYIP